MNDMSKDQPPAAKTALYFAESYSTDESVGYLMKMIIQSIVYQADTRLEAQDLTSTQWVPLLRLRNTGSSTVAELARWARVDAGAMTRLLDRLEKKGLCKRVRSTEDRRVVRVELTPAGVAAISPVPAVLADVMNEHLQGFTHAEWQTLKGYLKRMVSTGEVLREATERDRAQPD